MIGATESGWMKAETFFEFIANGFVPYLEEHEIRKPVVLFVDGHKTHLTMQVSQYCEDHEVILYLLPPNTTHLLQPAGVAVFKPLKSYWREEVHQFQRENVNAVVRKQNVGKMLLNVLKKLKTESIKNGFRVTGLFLLNIENVDFSKCLEVEEEEDEPQNINGTTSSNSQNYSIVREILLKELGEELSERCMNQNLNATDLTAVCTIVRNLIKPSENSQNSISVNLDAARVFDVSGLLHSTGCLYCFNSEFE